MSLTDTARHWLWGWVPATAARRPDVKVALAWQVVANKSNLADFGDFFQVILSQ